jgi:hypothetical protein
MIITVLNQISRVGFFFRRRDGLGLGLRRAHQLATWPVAQNTTIQEPLGIARAKRRFC